MSIKNAVTLEELTNGTATLPDFQECDMEDIKKMFMEEMTDRVITDNLNFKVLDTDYYADKFEGFPIDWCEILADCSELAEGQTSHFPLHVKDTFYKCITKGEGEVLPLTIEDNKTDTQENI